LAARERLALLQPVAILHGLQVGEDGGFVEYQVVADGADFLRGVDGQLPFYRFPGRAAHGDGELFCVPRLSVEQVHYGSDGIELVLLARVELEAGVAHVRPSAIRCPWFWRTGQDWFSTGRRRGRRLPAR